MANSVDPDQTAPIGAVCSGSTLFASKLNLSVMFGNYLQQTTSADDIFRCIFFLGALRANFQFHKYQTVTAFLDWVECDKINSFSIKSQNLLFSVSKGHNSKNRPSSYGP